MSQKLNSYIYCLLVCIGKKIKSIFIILLLLFVIRFLVSYIEITSTGKPVKSVSLKRNSFYDAALEEENVGKEENEDPPLLKGGKKEPKDLYAAEESHQDEKEDILSFNNINVALTNSKKNRNLSQKLNSDSLIKKDSDKFFVWSKSKLLETGYWNFRKYSNYEIKALSTLGRRLFLHENIGAPLDKKFIIYVYKFGKRLERRLIKHYSSKMLDPFENCSVKNCEISYNHSNFHTADAVLFHLHLISGPPTELERKNFNQRWVWLSDESIFNTFMVSKDKNVDHYNDMFNWSMTYRSDSDVPVPYGRTVPLLHENLMMDADLDFFSKKNKTVAIMGSSCSNKNGRWKYVKLLEKYIEVDTYGKCGRLKCPGHFNSDCPLLNSYKFYLAFENSNCKEYITEKSWWNAFAKGAVPIVMGTVKEDYLKVFPPNSFIHVQDFGTVQELAEYITYLSKNKVAYNKYHQWRTKYQIVNEHGYFQTNIFHYCRLCEALNYNTQSPKSYTSMKAFWNVSRDCNLNTFPLPAKKGSQSTNL